MSCLEFLFVVLCESCGFVYKWDIVEVMGYFDVVVFVGVFNGDDCVVLLLLVGQGYQLLVIEGLVLDFVVVLFWFVGYSVVMVNFSDIVVMGGWLLGVVDVLWVCDVVQVGELLVGM